MILALTESWDRHATIVIDALRQKGARCVRLQTEDIPEKIAVTLRFAEQATDHRLVVDGEEINLAEVTSVWFRRPGLPQPHPKLSPADHEFVLKETTHVLRGLWRILKDRFWVNQFTESLAADHKPYQLDVARSVGFRIPKTLITNDPEQVRQFYEQCNGLMIYKCFSSHGRPVNGRFHGIYTTLVTPDKLHQCIEQVRLAPCLFQEYVPKAFELRITIMGCHIFTDEVRSQDTHETIVDYRRYYLDGVPHVQSDVGADVKAMITAMMEELGLVFGCMDMIVTPSGEYVFLELNPNGQWFWVEDLTKMPLVDHFTEMLIHGSPQYSSPS